MSHRNIRLVEFKDEETYPITQSADGSNAYYCEFCNHAGYRPNYASCLRRIEDRKVGRLITTEAQCSAAIGNKACPAQAMAKEEKQAGHAIYYVNRIKMRQNQIENAELVGVKLGKRISRDLTMPEPRFTSPQDADIAKNIPQGIPDSPSFISAPTLADAINKKLSDLAKDEAVENLSTLGSSPSKSERVLSKKLVSGDLSKAKAPTETRTAPIKTEGLSLLDIARLRKQSATA